MDTVVFLLKVLWTLILLGGMLAITPPKEKKKVTLYMYTYLNGAKEMWQSDYTSVSWEGFKLDNFKLLKTESKEVEYG